MDTWDKKLRAGVGIGVAALGVAVAVVALSGVEAIGGPMFFIGMALAGAAGYAGVNQAIHAADSNYDARSAARDMLIGGLAGLASAVAMLWAAGGAATLAAAYEGGSMLTVAGIEAAGGMAFGTTSSLLEGRSMQESLANGLAAATMAVVPTVAAMGLGRLAGSFRGVRSAGGAGRIYHITDDFEQVVSSGRSWGQPEGSVYGMRVARASRIRTMMDAPVRDPGTIIFEGEAATVFKPHPIEGPYSLLKRLLGQQKTGFGDIVFDMSTATRNGNVLIVRNVTIGTHAGQSTMFAAARLWGRRALDIGLTGASGTAGGMYVYDILRSN